MCARLHIPSISFNFFCFERTKIRNGFVFGDGVICDWTKHLIIILAPRKENGGNPQSDTRRFIEAMLSRRKKHNSLELSEKSWFDVEELEQLVSILYITSTLPYGLPPGWAVRKRGGKEDEDR